MTVEELLVSIINPNATEGDSRVEIRKDDGYWFVDAVSLERGSFQYYSTDLRKALAGLFRLQSEARKVKS